MGGRSKWIHHVHRVQGVYRRAVAHHAEHAGPVLRDREVRVDGVQEPLEALAAQLLSQLQPRRHVPEGFLGTRIKPLLNTPPARGRAYLLSLLIYCI